ncbi:MAG: hypothetical protein LKE52_02125 [Bacilli bacterium]|jgi:DUF1365 family protein|nr:hypothetical protein [Bacilli bacterium]
MKTETYTRVDNGYGCRPDYIYHAKDGKDNEIEQDANYTNEFKSVY